MNFQTPFFSRDSPAKPELCEGWCSKPATRCTASSRTLLVAIFGGFFLGGGIGLSVRGGAVIDGTEVLAIFLSRKFFIFYYFQQDGMTNGKGFSCPTLDNPLEPYQDERTIES